MPPISIKLQQPLLNSLKKYCKQTNVTQQAGVQNIITRFLARHELNELQKITVPAAQKMGIYTDEDVFRLLAEDKKKFGRMPKKKLKVPNATTVNQAEKRSAKKPGKNSVFKLFGMAKSKVTDGSINHDKYIYDN